MKSIYYSEEELVVLSCYAGQTRKDTVSSLEAALTEMKEEQPLDEEMIHVLEELLDGVQSMEEEEFRDLFLLFLPNWDEEDIAI